MIPFSISDDDITAIETFLKRDFSDAACRSVLKARNSIDVQAAPGSGKTTLLVAKLAVMSEKWPYAGRGICVLSHTNVARLEIEKQLDLHPFGKALLGYPHFIGTIQSFVHQFIALPHIRGGGVHPRFVDNERFAASAQRAADSNAWPLVKTHLTNHPKTAHKTIGTLRFSGPDLEVVSEGSLPSTTTETYRAFKSLKGTLTRDGKFRFDDMFAIAQRALRQNPTLKDLLSTRFPVVFFDEMQDTDESQETLLTDAFNENCVLQRFGDRNQSIFDKDDYDGKGSSFPRPGFIDLPQSHRFGMRIAEAASKLTIAQVQKIEGNSKRVEKDHTIIVFNDASIDKVLPAFGTLIVEQCSDAFDKDFVAKVVATRKSGSGKTLPRHIGDYWPPFNADKLRVGGQSSLIKYVRRARSILSELGDVPNGVGTVWDGLLALLHLHRCQLVSGEVLARKSLLRQLDSDDEVAGRLVREQIRQLCLGDAPTQNSWHLNITALLNGLKTILPDDVSRGEDFLAWEEDLAGSVSVADSRLSNTYEHTVGDRRVRIGLNTIHSVKGETHNATLVVTSCRSRIFDLKEALPLLCGTGVRRSGDTITKQLMALFVGMTRPKDLLCLAVSADHCTKEHRNALRASGWKVEDLTQQATSDGA